MTSDPAQRNDISTSHPEIVEELRKLYLEREKQVPPGSKGVVFEVDLPAGKTELQTWLFDESGKAGGAYFTGVEKL